MQNHPINTNSNINRLRYFKTLCKYGNVSKAASELHLSQPSISIAIKELELELGIELFYRENNRLILTELGKVILDMSDDILQKVDEFYDQVYRISKQEISIVRLGVPPIMGTILVPSIYANIAKSYPFVELEMFEYTYKDSLKQLEENNLDLAIVVYHDNIHVNYKYEIFYSTELHFCVSRKNPLAKKEYIYCKELEDFPLTILSTGSFHNLVINDMFHRAGIKPRIVFQTIQLSTIINLVEEYQLGTFIYKDVFANNSKVASIPCEGVESIHLCVAWKKNKQLTSGEESVVDFLLANKFEL